MLEKTRMLYEGKAKKVFATDSPKVCIVQYKDDATAFNGLKKGFIKDKGRINNQISNYLMEILEMQGIPTHLLEEISPCETVVKRLTILPLEVIVRNFVAGSMAKKMGMEEGIPLFPPILELSYKNDPLGDPMINDDYAIALGLATKEDLELMRQYAGHINEILIEVLKKVGLVLVDFKLEFGKDAQGYLMLADEISPDTCRIWESDTGKKLDKDRFRLDLGQVENAYQEVFRRLVQ